MMRKNGEPRVSQKQWSLNCNLVVQASAGSGKTEFIKNCYLNILRERKAMPGEILCVTFTDKATREMRKRIFDAIESEVNLVDDEEERDYWGRVRRDFVTRGFVTTLHSFCAQTLSRHPRTFSFFDGFIVEDALVKKELDGFVSDSLREILLMQDLGTHDDDFPTLKNALDDFLKIAPDDHLDMKLIDLVARILYCRKEFDWIESFNFLCKSPSEYFADCFSTSIGVVLKDSWLTLMQSNFIVLWDEFYSNFDMDVLQGTSLGKRILALNCFVEKAQDLEFLNSTVLQKFDFDQFAKIFSQTYILYDRKKNKLIGKEKERFSDDEFNSWLCLEDQFLRCFPKSLRTLFLESEKEVQQQWIICRAIGLFLRSLSKSKVASWSENALLKRWGRQEYITYDDLQWLLIRQFQEKKGDNKKDSVDWSEIYPFSFVLVDESQDLDLIQQHFILELQKVLGDVIRLLFVGDEKQSIYRFRGADVVKFRNFITKTSHETLFLDFNYRSREMLVKFFNTVFSRLMSSPPLQKFESAYMESARSFRKDEQDSHCVEIWVCNSDSEKKSCDVYQRGFVLSKGIQKLRQEGYRYSDIAILFQTSSEIGLLERVLREHGIPTNKYMNQAWGTISELVDCVLLLRGIAFARRVDVIALIRSPWCSVSDEVLNVVLPTSSVVCWEQWKSLIQERFAEKMIVKRDMVSMMQFANLMQRLERYSSGMTPYRLLLVAMEEVKYREMMKAIYPLGNSQENLCWLLRYIREKCESRCLNLKEVIRELELQKDAKIVSPSFAGNDDGVTLTTVHKAKGLEFPIVLLPYLEPSGSTGKESYYESLQFPVPGVLKCGKLRLSNWFEDIEKEKKLAENKRLFYVAITRAQEKVVFFVESIHWTKKVRSVGRHGATWRDFLCFGLFSGKSFVEIMGDVPNSEETERIDLEKVLHDVKIRVSFWKSKFLRRNVGSVTLVSAQNEDDGCLKRSVKMFLTEEAFRHQPVLPVLPLSTPSSLKSYNECRRKYFYKYRLKIEETQKRKDVDGLHLPMNLEGNVIHAILGTFLGRLGRFSQETLKKIAERFLFSTKIVGLLHVEKRKKMADNLSRTVLNIMEAMKMFGFFDLQQPMIYKPEFSLRCKMLGGCLEGVLDLWMLGKDGKHVLLDYKISDEKNVLRHIFQMQMYRELFSKFLHCSGKGSQPIRLILNFALRSKQIVVLEEVSSLPKLEMDWLSCWSKEQMEGKEKNFPPNPGPEACRSCCYQMCEHWSRFNQSPITLDEK